MRMTLEEMRERARSGRVINPARPRPAKREPVPREKWRWPVRIVAGLRRGDEKGVGDTLARLIGNVGGEEFKRWYKRLTGQDCGCSDRQGRLNAIYPY